MQSFSSANIEIFTFFKPTTTIIKHKNEKHDLDSMYLKDPALSTAIRRDAELQSVAADNWIYEILFSYPFCVQYFYKFCIDFPTM